MRDYNKKLTQEEIDALNKETIAEAERLMDEGEIWLGLFYDLGEYDPAIPLGVYNTPQSALDALIKYITHYEDTCIIGEIDYSVCPTDLTVPVTVLRENWPPREGVYHISGFSMNEIPDLAWDW